MFSLLFGPSGRPTRRARPCRLAPPVRPTPAPVAAHIRPRPSCYLACLLLANLAAVGAGANSAAAQVVRGRLLDPHGPEGIGGALMTLVDQGDRPLANTLTRASGLFEIESPSAGRYRVKAERIGYATTWSAYFEVAAGDTLTIEITAQVEAISLAGIEVEGDSRCRVRPEEGLAVTRVWDEARKALGAAAWTQERGLYRYEMMQTTRELDPEGRRVISEDRTFQQGYSQSPYVALPADVLIEGGFARLTASESVYWAPDAAVLLSDPFLDTHCFRLRRDAGQAPGLIGLAFEPVPGRRLPEITGTLWLDPADGELKWLDFRYVNLGLPDPLNYAAGGRVEFEAMPNGTWIVNSWSIRMPRGENYENPFTGGSGVRLAGLVEQGGEVLRAHGSEEAVLEADLGGQIAGIVFDSLRTGLPGARVFVEGADTEVLTGRDGRFVLAHLRTGTYTVNFSHPYLDRLGFRPRPFEVDVVEGARTPAQINFVAPTVAVAVNRLCRELERRGATGAGGGASRARDPSAGEGVLLGRVTDPRGVPLAGVDVRIVARDYEVAREAAVFVLLRNGMVVKTNESGYYLACGVPVDTGLRVAVLRPGWGPDDGRSEAELLSDRAVWVEDVVPVGSGLPLATLDFVVETEPGSP